MTEMVNVINIFLDKKNGDTSLPSDFGEILIKLTVAIRSGLALDSSSMGIFEFSNNVIAEARWGAESRTTEDLNGARASSTVCRRLPAADRGNDDPSIAEIIDGRPAGK